jgi:hypothetical protein
VKSRTRLLPQNLEVLKLALAPDLEQFPISNAVSRRYNERRRRIGRLHQARKLPLAEMQILETQLSSAFEETEEEMITFDDFIATDDCDFD